MRSKSDELAPSAAAEWARPLAPESRRAGKLAPQLAKRIELEVFRLGWPVGRRLGKEDELATRFQVSRSVMREALAITERDGMTRRARGPSGGVLVAAPAEQAVAVAIGSYLTFTETTERHLMQGISLFHGTLFRLASPLCTAADAQSLRTLTTQMIPASIEAIWRQVVELHNCMLAISRNGALRILGAAILYVAVVRFYARFVDDQPAGLAFVVAFRELLARQAENIIADEPAPAIVVQQALIRLWSGAERGGAARLHADQLPLNGEQAQAIAERLAAVFYPGRSAKRSDGIAMQLHRAIQVERLDPGDGLDSEVALLQRYQVGRNALRDAIRFLERYGVVRMEEGRNGGLRVAQPEPGEAVRSAVLHFRFLKVKAAQLLDVGLDLELAAATAAAEHVAHSGAEVLGALREAVEAPPGAASDLQSHMARIHVGLAAATGNPVFITSMEIFRAFLTVGHGRETGGNKLRSRPYRQYLERMKGAVDALERADAALARRELLIARQSLQQIRPHARDLRDLLNMIY